MVRKLEIKAGWQMKRIWHFFALIFLFFIPILKEVEKSVLFKRIKKNTTNLQTWKFAKFFTFSKHIWQRRVNRSADDYSLQASPRRKKVYVIFSLLVNDFYQQNGIFISIAGSYWGNKTD